MAISRFMLAAVLSLLAGPALAADYPVAIVSARIGLPAGGDPAAPAIAKFAAWAPVYLELDLLAAVNEPAELVIEAPDADEISTTLVVPIRLEGASGRVTAASRGAIGYLRPAGVGEVTITVRAANGGKALSEPVRVRSFRPRDPLTYVVLNLGVHPTSFELPRQPGGVQDPGAGIRGGRVELAAITDCAELPNQWFGYDAADLVVLHTGPGTEEFLSRLFSETASSADQAKRAALVEWIRRGGRLVVAVGAGGSRVMQLPALQRLLPHSVQAVRSSGAVAVTWQTREGSPVNGALIPKGTFPAATFQPKPATRILIPAGRLDEGREVFAVQSAFGLGRITVIGFDLDRAPFTEMEKRPEFWDWILREGGASRASAGSEGKPRPGGTTLTEEEDEIAVALRTHADSFDGVPVISFGWVALLIVLYILLIGPIEYYFLKRVLGRLELTWITFPIIVLTVSLAAYFTAYSLKGRDLKINKLDVVDVDPASGRIYGNTWFTIFSPRIENYTLAVTPGEGWSAEVAPGTAVSWVGAPRGGRASLLRRGYRYHSDSDSAANGLENVPIQVWSTKSLAANWSAPFDPAGIDSSLLHPPADRSAVIGAFTINLPVPVLNDCVAFYAGQAYPIPGGTIRSGERVRFVTDQPIPAADWLRKESKVNDLLSRAPGFTERNGMKAVGPQPAAPAGHPVIAASHVLPLLGLLFHEASLTFTEGVIPRNASLRRLDQSWRLAPDNRSEVIVVGRVAPPVGDAEQTLSGPDSPSRLWIRALPGAGAARAPIPGTGRQETWVRVFIPVK